MIIDDDLFLDADEVTADDDDGAGVGMSHWLSLELQKEAELLITLHFEFR